MLKILVLQKYVRELKTDKDLEANAKPSDWKALPEAKVADKAFLKFRERIHNQPDQVINYECAYTKHNVFQTFNESKITETCVS